MELLFSVPLQLDSMKLRGSGREEEGRLILDCGDTLSTDTYFGCFPCEAYSNYTSVRKVGIFAELSGAGVLELRWLSENGDVAVEEIKYRSSFPEIYNFDVVLSQYQSGCLYMRIRSESSSILSRVWYEADGTARLTQIALIICTYKRDEYVLHNLKMLSDAAEADPLLKETIQVYCVDNGGTLNSVPDGIRLIKNRNYGGSGGYARGMIEARESAGYTHFWMMDDDIRFEPSILHRAVCFMKYRNSENLALAAGMFSFEEPTIQQEATSVFTGYTFVSNAKGLDFRKREALLRNRIEQNRYTYGGWWSLLMPATDQLPMPFFIKMDDVEYAIRQPRTYVVMNGFGVWHEAFGNKGNAWTEYYTTRNTLITQSLYPELPRNPWKMMGIRLLKALAYGEPKCMEAALQGVIDYARGADDFARTCAEKRHKSIMDNYHAPLAHNMSRKKMLGRAAGNMLRAYNWKSVGLYLKAIKALGKQKCTAQQWEILETSAFWRGYLDIVAVEDRSEDR